MHIGEEQTLKRSFSLIPSNKGCIIQYKHRAYMRPPCFLHFLPGAPRFPFVFQPRATSRVIHVTAFCATKAIRAAGDEADQNRKPSRKDDRKSNRKFADGKPQIPHAEGTEKTSDTSSTDSSNDEDFIQHLQIKQATRVNRKRISESCTVKINDLTMEIELDTGSGANIMDEEQFQQLQKMRPEIRLKKSRTKLRALLQDIPVLGECSVIIKNQTRQTRTRIIVIRGKMDSLPLIGRPTLSNP